MSKKTKIKFEKQLLKYLLIATIVPALILLTTLVHYNASSNLIVLIFTFLFCLTGYCASTLYQKIIFQFRTLSNLLEGMTYGDYSLRGRRHGTEDALGELVQQINKLADTLTEQRFTALESQLLVGKIIQHIDVAIVAIDENQAISLINPAAEKLLNTQQSKALGKTLEACGAHGLVNASKDKFVELSFAQTNGKFQVIHDKYREKGHQHELFFITDVNGLLRTQERQAWQDLIRVLSHEINNSLAPIASLSSTLNKISSKQALTPEFSENLTSGLSIITERAESLKGFINSYRQLSHLPTPKKQRIIFQQFIDKITPLFPAREILLENKLDNSIDIDPVQIEQVFINLLKNADEAMHKDQGKIIINADQRGDKITIKIIDEGNGIQNVSNLFTPFYTTKKQGSGIGLVLSRQIVEAHNGSLSIKNRDDSQGCLVTIQLEKS